MPGVRSILLAVCTVASLLAAGSNASAQVYRCVGDPPRQSEDPLAPPCVPFFEGDNYGDTAQGVTREEITVVVYVDDVCTDGSCVQAERVGVPIDLDQAALPDCASTAPARPANGCD